MTCPTKTAGRALDLACGFGRHAIWLHQQGWSVTAVDRNAEAIAQLRTDWPGIDARVVDLELESYLVAADEYDLIVCWLYHQPDLYPRIRSAVRAGGIAALCVLREGRFAASKGELLTHFPGWKILDEEATSARQVLVLQRPVE